MRKLALVVIGGLMVLPAAAQADNHEGTKVYYKQGTRIEFPNADIKFNVQLQPRYSYEDADSGGRVDAGGDPVEDVSNFDMRRARFIVSGNVLDKEFSYKLQNDFASDTGGGDLKDAWIQWNGDPAKIRFGQMKVPYSRQERISSTRLFFTERTEINGIFNKGREQGAQAHFGFGDGNAYVGIFNGDSDGEGANREGQDNKVNGYASLDFSSDNFGNRGEEGDFRDDGTMGFTVGGAVLYGEGNQAGLGGDFEQLGLNADAAIRCSGAELQAEYHYRQVEGDSTSLDLDQNGFYLQGTYVMDKIGLGARYGYFSPDDEVSAILGIDDGQEYGLVLNYFLNGHYLKIQNAVYWRQVDFKGGGDVTDMRYDLQLAGYF